MFFLDEDTSVRGGGATRFVVFDGDDWVVCAEGFKDDLPSFASPDLNQVLLHVFIFVFARADGHWFPGDDEAVVFAFCFCPAGTRVIW